MKKYNIIVLSFFFFVACKPAEEIPLADDFSPDALQKATQAECAMGRKLQENGDIINRPFTELSQHSVVIGFSGGQEKCLLTQNIHDRTAMGDFVVTLGSNCLENNSVWKIDNQTRTGDYYFYSMKRIDKDSGSYMRMSSTAGVPSSYIRSRLGMRAFNCK